MIKTLTLSAKLAENSDKSFSINGISASQWLFLFQNFIDDNKAQVFIFDDQDDAEYFYTKNKQGHNSLFFPDLCDAPLGGQISSERDLFDRFYCLSKLVNNDIYYIYTTYKALNLYIPNLEFFLKRRLELEKDLIISPYQLSSKLISLGYINNPTIEEPGTFSKKGEIFDIYPINSDPIRISYFDDLIEYMHKIDKSSLRTLKDSEVLSLSIFPSPSSIINNESLKYFLDNIPKFGPSQKSKQKTKESFIESVSNGVLFQNYPLYTSLFLEKKTTLFHYLSELKYSLNFINIDKSKDNFHFYFDELLQQYENNLESSEVEILPDPNLLYDFSDQEVSGLFINEMDMHNNTEDTLGNSLSIKLSPLKNHINTLSKSRSKEDYIKYLSKFLTKKHLEGYIVIFSSERVDSFNKFKHIFSETSFIAHVSHSLDYLQQGFIYDNEKLIVIAESDLFIEKIKKAKFRNNNEDIFAEQLSTLAIDDYIIHKEHGVGQYKGIETLEIGSQKGDFLIIYYDQEDKVYLPVHKLNLIQKYSSSQSSVKLASLKSKKFDQEKSKARKSVKKLAFDLLELQAKRKLKKGFKFSEPDELFYEFVDKFNFKDTPDQIMATEDIISDMCSFKPMDRLICGDVGFGKTEIAMRAAFKAIEDNKQIAILVPTTVLAFQHYNSFLKRFSDFPVNIEFISRFKSPKESKDILERLEKGKVDIIIGTHKLLSDKIKYYDLGLLIIDEEQRFGVSHKEKIKLFKENVDCLVLTATPIPRTLQLSFLGIKDLSLIKTAPPKRQSIKTYLIKEDLNTMRNAINKELSRGGQVFVVHNKVKDIEEYTAKISKLSPEAKIIYAHGQLPERELEKRITDFYNGKYDILVATTIIESGIDIPRANTMIIDRADTYGLSQLHQLRGRIGRSDKKAYAYFVIPSQRNISSIAAKRLKALQTYADMGSGFSLATSDLEIRGSGDILGAEQSGHIANIGLELYMELLQDAINEIQNNKGVYTRNIEIQTPFNAFIDSKYIEDSGIRLKYYKKISGSKNNDHLEEIKAELEDIYGLIPNELENLFVVLNARNNFNKLPLDSVKVASKQIILNFNQKELDLNTQVKDKLIPLFMERPKVYKIKPNYSVICHFKDTVNIENLLEFSKYIAMQIEAC